MNAKDTQQQIKHLNRMMICKPEFREWFMEDIKKLERQNYEI